MADIRDYSESFLSYLRIEKTASKITIYDYNKEIIRLSVKGMMPKNSLGNQMFKKLKIYAGSEHKHEAQKPEALEL